MECASVNPYIDMNSTRIDCNTYTITRSRQSKYKGFHPFVVGSLLCWWMKFGAVWWSGWRSRRSF